MLLNTIHTPPAAADPDLASRFQRRTAALASAEDQSQEGPKFPRLSEPLRLLKRFRRPFPVELRSITKSLNASRLFRCLERPYAVCATTLPGEADLLSSIHADERHARMISAIASQLHLRRQWTKVRTTGERNSCPIPPTFRRPRS